MPLSLEEQFRVANIVTAFERLYALDGIRTNYLQNVYRTRAEVPEWSIPEPDMRALERMTDEIDLLLQQAPDHARSLLRNIRVYSEELGDSYYDVLEGNEFNGNEKERLLDIVDRHGGILAYGRINAEIVVEVVPIERETLQAEMNTIRGGGFAAGDLSPEFLCNVAAMCVVGGLFAPPPMNYVGLGVGLLMIGSVYVQGEEC